MRSENIRRDDQTEAGLAQLDRQRAYKEMPATHFSASPTSTWSSQLDYHVARCSRPPSHVRKVLIYFLSQVQRFFLCIQTLPSKRLHIQTVINNLSSLFQITWERQHSKQTSNIKYQTDTLDTTSPPVSTVSDSYGDASNALALLLLLLFSRD